jgi:hypothetical protein
MSKTFEKESATNMKRTLNHSSKLATVIFAASFAFALAPVSRAQTTATSNASPAADTASRLQDLESEVSTLRQEIAALKANETPSVKTAAYAQPAAEQAPAEGTQAPAAAAAPLSFPGLFGPITFTGFVDAYYAFNFNQPAALGSSVPNGVAGNSLQFFDQNTNQFSLNAIEAVIDRAPDATANGTGRAGYHIGVIYGQAAEAINGSTATDASNLALKEAYVDYIAPIGKGLQFQLGKFVTPAGAEVIETNGNWNYSRSILFYYAIPYFHFGLNAKYVFNPKVSLTGYLVNGWNNTQEQNTGKTYGASLALTPNKYWAITENYLAGPQDDPILYGTHSKPNSNYRQLSDTVIVYTPNAKWSLQANGDYGYGDKYPISSTANSKAADWWGAAGYAKYAIDGKSYFAVRYEYFSDPQGLALFGAGNLNGHAEEGTATYAYNLTSQLQTRMEFRENFANRPIFLKGTRFVETEPLLEFGMIYTFSSANSH